MADVGCGGDRRNAQNDMMLPSDWTDLSKDDLLAVVYLLLVHNRTALVRSGLVPAPHSGETWHHNPSPSHCEAAWCNDCGGVVPLYCFDPEPSAVLS